jgi:hypothetical protein
MTRKASWGQYASTAGTGTSGQAYGGTTTRSCAFGDLSTPKSCNAVMESEYDFIVVGGRCLDHRNKFRTDDIQLEHRALCLPRVWPTPQPPRQFFSSKQEDRTPTPLINLLLIASMQPSQMDLL